MALKELARSKAFGGHVVKFSHQAACLGGLDANFNVYLPPKAAAGGRVPVLFCLAGLTCTEDNFIQKSGAIRKASQLGIALVCPDTSPRGANVEGEDDSWDFGTGAGFYVDATEEKWKSHYRMYTYIVDELPKAVQEELPLVSHDNDRRVVPVAFSCAGRRGCSCHRKIGPGPLLNNWPLHGWSRCVDNLSQEPRKIQGFLGSIGLRR
ncbi:MAG: Alpha/Beta hydrolase protein [Olpidium bornovanus]|uniref:S-formylglutathione hydrolase n=1 Tax=Olpidium bornovanus TaxID=278681 RepID=A0A8H8A0G5_9FUNG|nr:MAG: Alpha/Beta hydrolase protein [Olpidium bornovanus]